MKVLTILTLCTSVYATPPALIPLDLYEQYTLNDSIPVEYWYKDESCSPDQPTIYTSDQIDTFIPMAKAKQTQYYGSTDTWLYAALEKHLDKVQGKDVAVMGSIIPWYESILLAYGAKTTTIDYNPIKTNDPRLKLLTVAEFDANPQKFDAVVSISSFEHDGLGRYGDPLDPDGDMKAMEKTKGMLKEGGLLFLAVPIGKDRLVWNLHRIYGQLRLKKLLKGWRVVGHHGFAFDDLRDDSRGATHQPVFVLTPL
ncbi:MAG: DUF268 domain-containing protein [Verrucomicrobia bacterium]|nr:DUF268 domain-containing protein [Verrucomicrobiota bacterium]